MHTAVNAATDSTIRRTPNPPLESVLTARASRDQLHALWAEMDQPDEFSSPGPTRVATVKLSTGHSASVIFHERHGFIEILAPPGGGAAAGVRDLLASLGVASEAVTWSHADLNPMIASPRISMHDTGVCPHCGQPLNSGLEQFLGRLGITEDMVNSLHAQFQNVDIDEYLNTARNYLKDSGGKASAYAKENPGQVAAGIAVLALGAGLIYAAMREK